MKERLTTYDRGRIGRYSKDVNTLLVFVRIHLPLKTLELKLRIMDRLVCAPPYSPHSSHRPTNCFRGTAQSSTSLTSRLGEAIVPCSRLLTPI